MYVSLVSWKLRLNIKNLSDHFLKISKRLLKSLHLYLNLFKINVF